MRALLIEDDKGTAQFVVKGLKENGFVVDCASDGKEGLYLAATEKYDVMVVAILAFVWLTPPDWLGDPMASGSGPIGWLLDMLK